MSIHAPAFLPAGNGGIVGSWCHGGRKLRGETCRWSYDGYRVARMSATDSSNGGMKRNVIAAEEGMSRRMILRQGLSVASAVAIGTLLPISDAMSADNALGTKQANKLSGDYKSDASAVLEAMKEAWELPRGAPGMVDTVKNTRKKMNDFVALYRRNDKVSGSVSFSTLYTAINTLSGHYASFGPSYPVPEKRKKRLNTQFKDINKALARGR